MRVTYGELLKFQRGTVNGEGGTVNEERLTVNGEGLTVNGKRLTGKGNREMFLAPPLSVICT